MLDMLQIAHPLPPPPSLEIDDELNLLQKKNHTYSEANLFIR